MSKYFLNIYHRNVKLKPSEIGQQEVAKSSGHFYVILEEEGKIDKHPFSFYPKDNPLIGKSEVKMGEELETHIDLQEIGVVSPDKVQITKKTIPLTKEEFEAAKRYGESKSTQVEGNYYILGAIDCTDFTQDIYNAAGQPLYFSSMLYTTEELKGLGTMAAAKVLDRYGSIDSAKYHFSFLKDLNANHLAPKLNIELEKIKYTQVIDVHNPLLQDLHIDIKDISTLQAKMHNKRLESFVEKITQGIKLNEKELIDATNIAKGYFKSNKDSRDGNFHFALVSGEGELGTLSNSILYRQAKIDGIRDIEVKADNLKVLLASSHAKAVANSTDGKISLEQSNKLREDAFKSQGLSPYSDMCQVINAISSPSKCYEIKQLSDIGSLLQNVISVPSSSTEGAQLSNAVNLPETIAGISSFRGVSALRDGLSTYANPKSIVTIGPVIGASREEIARDFGVKIDQVRPKFSGAQNSALPINNNIDKIFEIIPPQEVNKAQSRSILFREAPQIFSPKLDALEKFNPEFLTRLMVAPLSSKPTGPSLNAHSLKPITTSREAIDNSKLQVSINKSYSEIHKTKNMKMSWVEGIAMYGPQYEIKMPADILNGNGSKNVWPSSIVTDSYRPGAHQISDFDTPEQIKSIVHNSPQMGPVKAAAMMNNCQTSSLSKLNIDPIVIDLTGNGLNFTSYKENKVLFDIDGDGFLEETGWVGADTGILVVDKKGNGVISNIQEIISEKFEGIDAKDGFEALRRYDANNDGIIDEHDPIFQTLRVWVNKDLDGITKPGELFKLSDLGITALIVAQNEITDCNEKKADNLVKAKSYCLLESGEKREIASVDFTANPSGHKYEETAEGIIVTSKSGTKSYTSKSKDSKKLEAEKLSVNNLYASENGGDILIGNDKDNWLVSRGGSNTYIGKEGDNTLVITAEDRLENIQAGKGFNTVLITGNRGMYFDLKKTGTHVLNGSNYGDFIDATECNYNTFIQAGDGDNVIIGGRADSALSGGRGNDIIAAGSANSLIRGHNGNNILIGGTSNNYIESGNGFNLLIGRGETNIFTANNSGYTIFDGSNSRHNIVKFSGDSQDYNFTRISNGDLIVKDLRPNTNSVSILKNIHEMKFSDISGITEKSILRAISIIPIEEQPKEINISCDQLIANHPSITKAPIFVSQVSDVKGGTVRMEYHNGTKVKNITFSPNNNYQGVMSFNYIAVDENENDFQIQLLSTDEFNGLKASLKSQVFFKKPSYPEGKLFYMQYYLSESNIFPLWKDYTGNGVKVAIVERGTFNPEHPDLKPNSLVAHPNPATFDNHANMVAGVIGAAFTGSGAVGVAPEVSLMSRVLSLGYNNESTPVVPSADIINLSCEWVFRGNNLNNMISYYGNSGMNEYYQFIYTSNIRQTIIEGRKGLGTVFIACAGNSKKLKVDTNYCALKSNPYLIVVGGMDKLTDFGAGELPYESFSTPGSNVLVSAPCYKIPASSLKLCNSFDSIFGSDNDLAEGTSFATPIISGIVALMLQANPHLGMIDVQNILAYSAKLISGTSFNYNYAKTFNGGGLHFNYEHGFGNVDAAIAVRLAETWITQNVTFNKLSYTLLREGSSILDFKTNTTSIVNKFVGKQKDFIIDKINLEIEGNDIQLDKLNISISLTDIIVGPNIFRAGAKFNDIMLSEKNTSEAEKDNFKLVRDSENSDMKFFVPLTNHFLGMKNYGLWEINIDYNAPITNETVFKSIGITFHGRNSINNTYIFTDEAALLYNSERSIIDCPEGINTINISSINSDYFIDLQNYMLTIMNNNYIVTRNSKIHNVFSGDRGGNENMIFGNELDNILIGGRGNDYISGIAGHNIICGGGGDNYLYSGIDADMFVIRKNLGSSNHIIDFKPNLLQEVINIVGFSNIKSFKDLIFEQQNEDLLITLEGQSLILVGKTKSNMKEENFIFDNHFNFHSQFAGEHLEWNSSLEYIIYHT